MVYKKYIKRGGKIYGPYVYHSRRVDGKVVSEYHGPKKQIERKNYLWIFLGIGFLMAVLFFAFSDKSISGNAVLGFESNSISGEVVDGILTLSLREGELLPSDSKLIFEDSNRSYEYNLSDLISDDSVEGDFYLEGKNIGGYGLGYGRSGLINNPEISFILDVSYVEPNENSDSGNSGESDISKNETFEDSNFSNEENVSQEILNETIEFEDENSSSEEILNNSEEKAIEEEILNDSEESNVEVILDEENEEEFQEDSSASPITGAAVSSFFKWRGTGNVVLESKEEIYGEVSKDKDFIYEILEGQTVEIRKGSVEVNGEILSEDILEVKIEENNFVVSTNYSKGDLGFGKDYLGEEFDFLTLNLSDLNHNFLGNLKISLVYENESLVFLETFVNSSNESEELFLEEILPAEFETIVLTQEEKDVLRSEFGDAPVVNIRSEVAGDDLFIGYQISNERVEFVYDYSLDKSYIKERAESDKNKWLKGIAADIVSRSEDDSQDVKVVDSVSNI